MSLCCTTLKYAKYAAPAVPTIGIAQNFMFGTNTGDNSAGIYETNSPTNIHPNRRYQIWVNALEQHYRGRRTFFDTTGTKNFTLPSNARLWVSDGSTGELKPCKLDTVLKYLNLNLTLPYSSITGTPAVSPSTITVQGAISSTVAGQAFTLSAPAQVSQTLTGANGISISSADNTFTISSTKRQETYSGTTNVSGLYTVTYSTAYSVAPNVQFQINGGLVTHTIRLTASTTTGFTVYVQNRTDIIGLLPSYSNVSGASVDILVTEK